MPQSLKGFNLEEVHLSLSDIQTLKYRPFLIVLFVTVITYMAVGIFYKLVSFSLTRIPVEKTVLEAAIQKELTAREPLETYKVIIDRNLFGSIDKTLSNRPVADKRQPAIDIAALYELRGTVAGDEHYGFAVLEEKSKRKQKLYKAGDSVAGGKIVKILRNSIVLRVGGDEKVLKIVETKEAPIFQPGSAVARRLPPAAGIAGTIVVRRNEINDWMKDISSLLSQAQIRPYFSMGKPAGFLVTNIRQGSVYQKLGISNGDIIEGVNNQDIKTADDMMTFYNTMKGASNMSLNIKRQGRQEKLNYVFQ